MDEKTDRSAQLGNGNHHQVVGTRRNRIAPASIFRNRCSAGIRTIGCQFAVAKACAVIPHAPLDIAQTVDGKAHGLTLSLVVLPSFARIGFFTPGVRFLELKDTATWRRR